MHKLEMTIGGRTVRLRWDVEAWLELENNGRSIGELIKATESDRPNAAWLEWAAAMINAGDSYANTQAEHVDVHWLAKRLSISQLATIRVMCELAYVMGQKRQDAAEDDEEEAVDLVAMEIAKKKEKAKSRQQETA